MKIALAFVLAALASAAIAPTAQAQGCPPGSLPSVDMWGNKICKRLGDGAAVTTQAPRGQRCPLGSHPTVDNFGNQVCRAAAVGDQPQTDYYDTSKGCPIGTVPGFDEFGRKGCKRF